MVNSCVVIPNFEGGDDVSGARGQLLHIENTFYWETGTYFTTILLHNYNSKSDCGDYNKN
jgi:hypothetical protein